ncbi:MAG TPA: glycosyltransferase family 2 protein [Xanthobacteraceae bacterium]|nr:glycosyltransferase family 2 protein [Xanthobacteraceae bacterium]
MADEFSGENPIHAALAEVEKTFAGRREIELTILMPCLNEAETIGRCIDKAMGFLASSGIAGEVVIADNGSTDGSREIARGKGARVVPIATRGYGAALIGGIEAARGRFVVMGDSDDSYDFSNLGEFVGRLREGYELVMGNRFKGGIAKKAMPSLHRYLGNPVLSFIGRLFFRSPIGDFHCGLRGFSREAMRKIGLVAPGMEFASEMVIKATIAGLRIAEVPTTLSPDGRSRPPHLRSWRDGWRHLKLLLNFAPHWLFLYPGAALVGLGVLLTAALLPGPVTVGQLKLDSATILFALAAVLVGAQMVMFYLVAKLHSVSEGLLPASPRFSRIQHALTVDRFCLAGGAMFAAGLLIAAAAIVRWMHADFGDLDPSLIVRFAALSTAAMALGVQIVTTGFLMELIRGRRHTIAAMALNTREGEVEEKVKAAGSKAAA